MFSIELSIIPKMVLAAIIVYLYIVLITRIAGKRTFAKMSSFDFAITIAMGSLLADAVNNPVDSLIPVMISLALLAFLQISVSFVRARFRFFEKATTNTPILVMRNGKILEKNLQAALMTKSDLMAKLREANVLKLEHAKAVIMETTGDVSVLHADEIDEIDAVLLENVKS
ncbi:MAG: DUF421 domain-containing protein [Saprospiraceae bacterium]